MPEAAEAITLRGYAPAQHGRKQVRLLDLQRNETAYLISIAPIPFHARHKHVHAVEVKDPVTGEMIEEVRNFREYHIAAAAKGEFTVLEVTDAFVRTISPSASRGTDVAAAPLSAREVAQELLKEWVLNGIDSNPLSCWGMAVLETPEPTQDDLNQLNAIQTAYCEAGCARAQQEYMNGNGAQFITDHHRKMAAWLGAADKYKWCGFIGKDDTKMCIACKQPMPADATFHAGQNGCGQNLLQYIEDGNITLNEVRKQDPLLAEKYIKYMDRKRKGSGSAKAEVGESAETVEV